MARLDLDTEGEATATVAIPGGSVEIRAGDLVDREAEARGWTVVSPHHEAAANRRISRLPC